MSVTLLLLVLFTVSITNTTNVTALTNNNGNDNNDILAESGIHLANLQVTFWQLEVSMISGA